MRGGRSHTAPPPPSERTQASTQTPTRTRPARKHQTPTTHRANTPTTSPAATPTQTQERPRQGAWAQQCERRGTRGSRATGQNEAQTHDAGTQTAHTRERKQPGLRRVPPAPARGGDSAREGPLTIAHARARGLSVFVGVFADVCRRFWAGWFGGLGVFWGCLVCFLVF